MKYGCASCTLVQRPRVHPRLLRPPARTQRHCSTISLDALCTKLQSSWPGAAHYSLPFKIRGSSTRHFGAGGPMVTRPSSKTRR
jgi:hypothetical protein